MSCVLNARFGADSEAADYSVLEAAKVRACPDVTANVLLVVRPLKPSLANRRSSKVPAVSEAGTVKGHEPEARGLPGVLEQLTYIQSMNAALALPG